MRKFLLFTAFVFSVFAFGQTYCGPLNFEYIDPDDPVWNDLGDEPITLVNFAGINNTSGNTPYIGVSHEMFLSQTANVTTGNTYPITIKGNTVGFWTNVFVVFIDWNQNGVLNDAGEVYSVTQTLSNSTGLDSQQVTHNISVPTTALPGNTRMRVKKLYDDDEFITDLNNPCVGGVYGQAEDYTVNVTAGTMAVSEQSAKNISLNIYPNPVENILYINSKSKIKSLHLTDITGKNVLKNINNTDQLDVSQLTKGVYIIKIITEDGSETSKKFIKK